MAIQRIRRVLNDMPEGQIFATRDMLKYGSRNNVDVALHRLCAREKITRLAQGLYMKGDSSAEKPPIEVIARAKASAFHRTVANVSRDLATKLELPFEEESVGLFATNGRSSAIKSCYGIIQFIGGALRKVIIGDSAVAVDLRNVWLLGKQAPEKELLRKAITEWTSLQWDECDARIKQLPQWLSDWLHLPLHRPGAVQFQIN